MSDVEQLEHRVTELEAELHEQQRINAEDRRALANAFDVGDAMKGASTALRKKLDAVHALPSHLAPRIAGGVISVLVRADVLAILDADEQED